jgi:hypothetical protein
MYLECGDYFHTIRINHDPVATHTVHKKKTTKNCICFSYSSIIFFPAAELDEEALKTKITEEENDTSALCIIRVDEDGGYQLLQCKKVKQVWRALLLGGYAQLS